VHGARGKIPNARLQIEMSEQLTTPEFNIEQLRESILITGKIALEAFADVARKLAPALEGFYQAVWQAYRDAGAPYGETDEGLLRFVRELSEARRLQLGSEGEEPVTTRGLQSLQIWGFFRVYKPRGVE
jgi:hypothetical protein